MKRRRIGGKEICRNLEKEIMREKEILRKGEKERWR